jgi:hypothetical protein
MNTLLQERLQDRQPPNHTIWRPSTVTVTRCALACSSSTAVLSGMKPSPFGNDCHGLSRIAAQPLWKRPPMY